MKTYTQSSTDLHMSSSELWAEAIRDAQKEIAKARSRRRVAKLRNCIEVFKKRIEAGEPWPGRGTLPNASTQN
jgi:hypothetical protein